MHSQGNFLGSWGWSAHANVRSDQPPIDLSFSLKKTTKKYFLQLIRFTLK